MKYLGQPQSGSIADQTFARNRGGQYVRARNGRGGAGNAYFGGLSAAWSAITDAQRQLWIEFAAVTPFRSHALGRQIELSGFGWFCRQNCIAATNFAAIIQPEPVVPAASSKWATCVLQSAAWTGLVISFVLDFPAGSSGACTIESSGVVTPGTMSGPGKGRWWKRFWGVSWGALDVPPATFNDAGQWVVTFGTPASADWMFFRIRCVDYAFSYAGPQVLRIQFP